MRTILILTLLFLSNSIWARSLQDVQLELSEANKSMQRLKVERAQLEGKKTNLNMRLDDKRAKAREYQKGINEMNEIIRAWQPLADKGGVYSVNLVKQAKAAREIHANDLASMQRQIRYEEKEQDDINKQLNFVTMLIDGLQDGINDLNTEIAYLSKKLVEELVRVAVQGAQELGLLSVNGCHRP